MSDVLEGTKRIKVGKDVVDVSELKPMTLGDKRKLKELGIDFIKAARERTMDPQDESKFILYMLQKFRPETTIEEVEEISALVGSSFLQFAMARAAEVDDPFSTRSTSLGQPMGGASAKLPSEATPSS